jgi:hypothetical protein
MNGNSRQALNATATWPCLQQTILLGMVMLPCVLRPQGATRACREMR